MIAKLTLIFIAIVLSLGGENMVHATTQSKNVVRKKSANNKTMPYKKKTSAPARVTLTLDTNFKPEPLPKNLAEEIAMCPGVLGDLKGKKWKSAILGARNKCVTLYKLSLWLSLYNGGLEEFLDEYMMLYAEHDLPARTRTTASLERLASQMKDNNKIANWFRQHPPKTADGKMAFAENLDQKKEAEKIRKLLAEVWTEMDLTETQYKFFIKTFRSHLSFALNGKRMSFLLWHDKINSLKMLMPILSPEDQGIARFCLDAAAGKKNLPKEWHSFNAKQKFKPIVLFHMAKWYRKNRMPEMYKFWHKHLPHIQIDDHGWWKELYRTVFNGLHSKRYDEINLLLGQFIPQKEKGDIVNSLWMKGWIHIKYMPKTKENLKVALTNFEKLFDAALLVHTKAQAAYWAGITARELSEHQDAQQWFEKAAEFTTTYYGQLATDCLHKKYEVRLDEVSKASSLWMEKTENFKTISDFMRLMAQIDLGWEIYDCLLWFVTHAKTQDQGAGILEFTQKVYPPSFVFISRSIMSKFGVQLQGYYPLIISSVFTGEVDPALVHAVIHQESSFLHPAVSSAGATGMMQFMSHTAKEVGKKLGIRIRDQEDLKNPVLNMQLGQRYLADLMKQYDNCLPAVLAAYNAGPQNANDWIKALGHPCQTIDINEWIEGVPFFETRHYIKAVMANYRIYRILLAQRNQKNS